MVDRYLLIREVQDKLDQLCKDICPLCAEDAPFQCECFKPDEPAHILGACKANDVRKAMHHLDDIRHQFANAEFNSEEKPRAVWDYTNLRENL